MSFDCSNCMYWLPIEVDYGCCHRHAPQAVTVDRAAEYMARWPETEDCQWCGEHRLGVHPARDSARELELFGQPAMPHPRSSTS